MIKELGAIVLTIALMSLCAHVTAANRNYIQNASFEKQSKSDKNLPEGWNIRVYPPGASKAILKTCRITRDKAHGGKRSLHIDLRGFDPQKAIAGKVREILWSPRLATDVQTLRGKKLRFSGHIYYAHIAPVPKHGPYFLFKLWQPGNKFRASQLHLSTSELGIKKYADRVGRWIEFSHEFAVPWDTESISLQCGLELHHGEVFNSTSFYLDDLCLEAVQGSPPKRTRKPTSGIYTLPETNGELTLKEGNFDDDPQTEIMMANRFFTLVIEPQRGAVISSFLYRGVDFTQPSHGTSPGGGGGVLSDHVTSQPPEGDWWEAAYRYTVLEKGPDRIRLRLSCPGKTGPIAWLTVHKIITVWRDRSDVQVDYDLAVSMDAQAPLEFAFWFHSFAGVQGAWGSDKRLTYFFPTESGIREVRWGKKEHWLRKPARGWEGFVDSRSDTGFAFAMEYKYVDCFYTWGSPDYRGVPTLEWRFTKMPVQHGESLRTSVHITPFHGLSKISGAGRGMVGSIRFADGKVRTSIVSAKPTRQPDGRMPSATILVRHRVLPETEWHIIGQKQVNFSADTPVTAEFNFTPARDGTHVFSAIVSAPDGKELLEMEEPYVVGTASGTYAPVPREKRFQAPKAKELDLSYTSMEVETQHVKWARPYCRGKVKAIILMHGFYQRDIIELAQRMDLDFDTTYCYPKYLREFGDHLRELTPEYLKNGLEKLFARNPDWEVMLLTGAVFKQLTPQQRETILNRVRGGAGLVVIQPVDIEPLNELSPLKPGGRGTMEVWRKEKDHFITSGFPFEAMPRTTVAGNEADAHDVLISAGKKPVLAVKAVGKGRVVALGYGAGLSSLVPLMCSSHWDLAPPPSFPCHEYHFSLLARAVLWAAQKEPRLRIERMKAADKTLNVSFHSETARSVSLHLRAQDKYGVPVGEHTRTLGLARGATNAAIPLPQPLPNGLNLFDLIVKDDKGRVLDWGTTSTRTKRPVGLTSVHTDKKMYKPDDTVRLDVALQGKVKGLSLLGILEDGFGRVVARKETPVSGDKIAISLPLTHALNKLLLVKVELSDRGNRLDAKRLHRTVVFPPKASAHEGDPVFYGWNNFVARGMSAYLLDIYCERLAELGINSTTYSLHNIVPSYVAACERRNFGRIVNVGGWGRPPSTGDKDHPTRGTCLNDPAVIAGHTKIILNYTFGLPLLGLLGGDENRYSNYEDICFSPHCMKDMRAWLQKQYSSLDALNKQWGTAFKTWEDVRPLTLKETRAKGDRNFSSWCDHRSFGEFTTARYCRRMREVAESLDPRARYSISGTQLPEPHSGYDYWCLSKALSSAYVYYGRNELVSWAGDGFDLYAWTGYPTGARTQYGVYNHFLRGGTGVAFCGVRILFTPDMRFSRCGQSFAKYYKPIQRGVGRLLIESRLVRDPLAMHYSQNSGHVANALGHNKLWLDSRFGFRSLAEYSGFDPDNVSYEQLAAGRVGNCKVLCLPMSCSLSGKEVTAVDRFVREGGIVIGQLAIGIADGHGRIADVGGLDKVFGIGREKSQLLKYPDVLVSRGQVKGLRAPEVEISLYETGLHAASAKVMGTVRGGEEQVIFVNSHGKGLAVYLGCDLFSAYRRFDGARFIPANDQYAAALEEFLRAIVVTAGVRPRLRITDENRRPVPGVKTALLARGPVQVFGLLRNRRVPAGAKSKPIKAYIQFPNRSYVRDILEDTNYGLTDHVPAAFAPITVKLYSVLPYNVTGLAVDLAQTSVKAGQSVPFRVSVKADGTPGDHVLRVDVFDPRGDMSGPYSRNLSARAGVASGTIPTAINDLRGEWRIKVKDLTSGRETTASFTIK